MKKLLIAWLVLLAMLGVACDGGEPEGEKEETPKAEETGPAEEGRRISITAGAGGNEYSFDMPSSVRGGFVDVGFKNTGKLKHEAAFIKMDPEMPQDQFVKDLKVASGEEGGPIASYLKPYVGPAEVEAGKTGSWNQALPAGTYYLVCALTDADSVEGEEGEEGEEGPKLPQHFEQGMIKKVTVTGPSQVALPTTDAVITGKEYSFDVSGLKAGSNDVLFRNDGPKENHMAAVLEFPKGVDEAAANKAVQAFFGEGPPPPGTPEPEDVGFSGLFEVGGGSVFQVEAKSGQVYAILCFIQDRAGGPPHAAKGMVKVLTIK